MRYLEYNLGLKIKILPRTRPRLSKLYFQKIGKNDTKFLLEYFEIVIWVTYMHVESKIISFSDDLLKIGGNGV